MMNFALVAIALSLSSGGASAQDKKAEAALAAYEARLLKGSFTQDEIDFCNAAANGNQALFERCKITRNFLREVKDYAKDVQAGKYPGRPPRIWVGGVAEDQKAQWDQVKQRDQGQ